MPSQGTTPAREGVALLPLPAPLPETGDARASSTTLRRWRSALLLLLALVTGGLLVGAAKEGVAFASEEDGRLECIVSGGLGTMPVAGCR